MGTGHSKSKTISALREEETKGNNCLLYEIKNLFGFFFLNIPPPEVSSCYFLLGKKIKKTPQSQFQVFQAHSENRVIELFKTRGKFYQNLLHSYLPC